ncbi:MAG: thiolase family protein [Acidobacteriota bacterium]
MEERLVVVAAKRSPFGKYLGALAALPPLELAVQVARATLASAGADLTGEIEQVFAGNCIQASFETGSVNGRQIALALGIGGFATTVDTACCSPLTALRLATWGLKLGRFRTALVVGVESMSRTPHIARGLRSGVRMGAVELVDPIFPIEYKGYSSVAVDASDGAERYGVSKRMLDAWALGSHRKYAAAAAAGKLDDEIVPVEAPARRGTVWLAADESPRAGATLAAIEQLPPVFGAKTTTAGNAPGLNDGAAAVVVMTETRACELGLAPLAEILATAEGTDEPRGISWIPALVIRQALAEAGLSLSESALIEINEAFAAMPLVSTKVLAGGEESAWFELLSRTNVNGGAVAIGHPVGASGLRILMSLIYELRRRGGGAGVAAICGGLTQGEAVVVRAEGGRHV